ncbi:MAG: ThiF family adenylyltransferase, partial [Candidatus Onthovivens sp.]|nr:ThiF family adenylyltransferase [Candidatus Onthovivens sp.]
MSLDDRTRLLINQNNLDKLSKIKVLVVGLGGVGSIVPISLVRSGVKNITIIDKDKVDDSNLNRQIAYNFNDIGTLKSVALKKHLLEIRSDINVTEIHDDIKNISSLNDK